MFGPHALRCTLSNPCKATAIRGAAFRPALHERGFCFNLTHTIDLRSAAAHAFPGAEPQFIKEAE